MRTNWASGDKVTAADLNEISTMLAEHDTTIAAHDGASGFYLVPGGQPAPTDLPDGVIVVMEDPTGGTAV